MKTKQLLPIFVLFYMAIGPNLMYAQQKKPAKKPVAKFNPPVKIKDDVTDQRKPPQAPLAPSPGDKLTFDDLEWMIARSKIGIAQNFLDKKNLKLQKTARATGYFNMDTLYYIKGNDRIVFYKSYEGFSFVYSTTSESRKDSLLQSAGKKGYTITDSAGFVKQFNQQVYLQKVTSYSNYNALATLSFDYAYNDDRAPWVYITNTDGDLIEGKKYYSLAFTNRGFLNYPPIEGIIQKDGMLPPLPPSPPPNESVTETQQPEYTCRTCDTITLAAGKPVLIFINTDSHYDNKEKNDSVTFYKILNRKGHWEDIRLADNYEKIKSEFPEAQYHYLHIYKTCYLQFNNQSHQKLSLLDGSHARSDFIYWSGNTKDPITRSSWDEAYSELSRATGRYKLKPEYQYFLRDSLALVRYKNLQSATAGKEMAGDMNTFLLQSMDDQFPLAFIHVQKVKRLLVSSNDDNAATTEYNFNENGQLTRVNRYSKSSGRNTVSYSYKNGLPLGRLKNNDDSSLLLQYAYTNDTLIVLEENYTMVYKHIGQMFFLVDEYKTSGYAYRECNLRYYYYQLAQDGKNDKVCLASYRDRECTNFKNNVCVANTRWQLPLTVDEYDYKLNGNGDLDINRNGFGKTYKIREGKLLSDEHKNVYYEYYE